MIHYYVIFYSYLPKLNSQLFSYQIWAGRKSQFFFSRVRSAGKYYVTYMHTVLLYLDIFFLMCTVDGRNPVPPGLYRTQSMMWKSTSELVQYQRYNHEHIYQWTRKPWKCEDEIFFSIFWLCMKSGPRDWIHLFFQRIVKTPMSGARSRGRGGGWIITIKGGSCARQAWADTRREGARDPTLLKCDFPTGILGGPNVIYRHMSVVYMLFFEYVLHVYICNIYIYIYIHT